MLNTIFQGWGEMIQRLVNHPNTKTSGHFLKEEIFNNCIVHTSVTEMNSIPNQHCTRIINFWYKKDSIPDSGKSRDGNKYI